MKEIVLAIRLGPESAEPTGVAIDLATRTGAHITVAYVATELQVAEFAAPATGMDPKEEHERLLVRAEAELAGFLAAHLADVPAEGRVLEGRVEERVTELARELDAGFIVVGTRGRGALARLVLGDTVQAILQRTPCPVIVVPLREPRA